MSIVKMKRLRLIALSEQREELMSSLLHIGCVEVTETEARLSDPEWAALVRRDTTSLGDVKAQANAITSALGSLKKYAPPKGINLMEKRAPITEQALFDPSAMADALRNASEINECTRQIAQLYSQENKLNAAKASLIPWMSLELPLEMRGTEYTRVFFCVCPAAADLQALQKELNESVPLAELFPVSADKEQHYMVVICHTSQAEELQALLHSRGVSFVGFKQVAGTPAENVEKLQRMLADVLEQRRELEERIAAMASCRQDLKICLDRLNQDLAKEGAKERLLTDGTIFFLEGWVSVPELPALEEELAKYCCSYETAEPGEEETVPTLLRNPKWMRCMNMVTEMYSLPEYHRGIDPNPLMFFFYIIFFGFMFADLAYGIIIFAVCTAIIKAFRPKNTMDYMFHLGQYLGISTAVFGVLTGGFFGDAVTQFCATFLGLDVTMPCVVNPLQSPMVIMVIALIMGAIHMIFGQCIHIYMEARDGRPLEGLLDVVPWWIVFAGIGVFALTSSPWGIALGFLSLLLTQGRHKKGIIGKLFGGIASWYDITSWLGDILSYCRLMALMLATSVIAQVFNILATLPAGGLPLVIGLVIFLIIFCVGHVFNIGINLIGTYVHAARLQYLEFFGKFYIEGGIPFRPLKYNTKYVDVVDESGEVRS